MSVEYYWNDGRNLKLVVEPGNLQKIIKKKVLSGTTWQVKDPRGKKFDFWEFINSDLGEQRKIISLLFDRWCFSYLIKRKAIAEVPKYATTVESEFWTFNADELLDHIDDVLRWYRAIHYNHPTHLICNPDFINQGAQFIHQNAFLWSRSFTVNRREYGSGGEFGSFVEETFNLKVIVTNYVKGIIPLYLPPEK